MGYFSIEVEDTKSSCPAGEKVGLENITEGKIPVISCEVVDWISGSLG